MRSSSCAVTVRGPAALASSGFAGPDGRAASCPARFVSVVGAGPDTAGVFAVGAGPDTAGAASAGSTGSASWAARNALSVAGAGHIEMVTCPGTGHEQHAALPLEVLDVRQRILILRGEGRRIRDHALLDADHRDGLELQALHGVHGAGPDPSRPASAADRRRVDAIRFQSLAGLAHQAGGSGRHPDRVRFEADRQPCADPFGKESEFLAAGGGETHLRVLPAHRGAVAEQGVDLAVQAGDGL